MRNNLLSILIISALAAVFLFGCTGSEQQPIGLPDGKVDIPAQPADEILAGLPALDELGEPVVESIKGTSATIPADLSAGNFTNANFDGSSVQMDSTGVPFSAMVYGLRINYPAGFAPFLAPYEVTIDVSGGGEYWVALADYGTGRWNFMEPTSDASYTFDVLMDANAANHLGNFWFAVVTHGGNNIAIDAINMEYPDAPAPGNPLQYTQYVEMSDGTLLATDIFLPLTNINPPQGFQYPLALVRTPYDKILISDEIRQAAAVVGVPLMVQYFRGRLNDSGDLPDSTGSEEIFRDHAGPEYNDAIETVDWIEARHWYNGQLVATGPSALGLWTYQAAPELGDRLLAYFPQVGAADIGEWAGVENGCFKKNNIETFVSTNSFPPSLLTEFESGFDDYNGGDDTYIGETDFNTRAGEVTAPAFHHTGWWDVDVEETIRSWKELNENGGTGAAGNHWLLIGPWDHGTIYQNLSGDYTFPDGSDPMVNDATNIPAAWDGIGWLVSELGRNPFYPGEPSNKVRFYIAGEEGSTAGLNNRWAESATWPPTGGTDLTYFLDGGGGLATSAPGDSGELGFVCDPANPLPTIGGANLIFGLLDQGPKEQAAALADGTSYELFSTTALGDTVTIAGPIAADLYVSTDAVDTDIMVKLIDEYPGGEQYLIADGAVRLSHYLRENSLGSVVADTIYNVEFEVAHRAYHFEAGHKIVVVVQSSNFPRFDVNPGNGDARYTGDNGVVQNNKLYYGGTEQSTVTLRLYSPPT